MKILVSALEKIDKELACIVLFPILFVACSNPQPQVPMISQTLHPDDVSLRLKYNVEKKLFILELTNHSSTTIALHPGSLLLWNLNREQDRPRCFGVWPYELIATGAPMLVNAKTEDFFRMRERKRVWLEPRAHIQLAVPFKNNAWVFRSNARYKISLTLGVNAAKLENDVPNVANRMEVKSEPIFVTIPNHIEE